MRILLLLTCVLLISCVRGPEKAKKRIAEYRTDYPELFKDSVRIDTVKSTVSVTIPAKPIDVGVIDSLLEEYCTPDTVERLVIKDRIKDRITNLCKLSAVLPIETITKQGNATMTTRIVTNSEGKEELRQNCECECIEKNTTTYAPCPDEPSFLAKLLAVWPIIAILVLIIIAQNVLRK